MIHPMTTTIRAKKLAVLIRDARETAGRTKTECSEILGISTTVYSSYENGESSPSLPELEMLAYFLNVPLDHFWGNATLSAGLETKERKNKLDSVIPLRQRIIGARLAKIREDVGMSLAELSRQSNLPTSRIKSYEAAERSVPLPELEVIASVYGISVQDFFDTKSLVGSWAAEQKSFKQFLTLTPDLQDFIGKPINHPYLEIAMRLSEMSVDKLRAVAEGLLEITL